jgi:hypothetical protein
MKTLAILIASATLCVAQQQQQWGQIHGNLREQTLIDQNFAVHALAAAIQQNQNLQSYGDDWARRHGTQYNPWTSYYQWRAERQGRTAPWWAVVVDEDR